MKNEVQSFLRKKKCNKNFWRKLDQYQTNQAYKTIFEDATISSKPLSTKI